MGLNMRARHPYDIFIYFVGGIQAWLDTNSINNPRVV